MKLKRIVLLKNWDIVTNQSVVSDVIISVEGLYRKIQENEKMEKYQEIFRKVFLWSAYLKVKKSLSNFKLCNSVQTN